MKNCNGEAAELVKPRVRRPPTSQLFFLLLLSLSRSLSHRREATENQPDLNLGLLRLRARRLGRRKTTLSFSPSARPFLLFTILSRPIRLSNLPPCRPPTSNPIRPPSLLSSLLVRSAHLLLHPPIVPSILSFSFRHCLELRLAQSLPLLDAAADGTSVRRTRWREGVSERKCEGRKREEERKNACEKRKSSAHFVGFSCSG